MRIYRIYYGFNENIAIYDEKHNDDYTVNNAYKINDFIGIKNIISLIIKERNIET